MDQGRVVAHLDLALGRETRLWRGGELQVLIPASGPSRACAPSPPPPALGRRMGSTCALGSGDPTQEARNFPRCVPA